MKNIKHNIKTKVYTEKDIIQSKNPKEYINRCVMSSVPSGRKSAIAKKWMEKTGYTVEDIKYARHRHPYWKAKKLQGNTERNKKRILKHNYRKTLRYRWPVSQIKKFIELNSKDSEGKYILSDIKLAKIFEATIPSIQGWRRKQSLIHRIFKKINADTAVEKKYFSILMQSNELTLRKELYKKEPSITLIVKTLGNRKKYSKNAVFNPD